MWVWLADADGRPLPNVGVRQLGGDARAVTDDQGIARLTGLPTGVGVVLAVEGDQYAVQQQRVVPSAAPPATVAMRVVPRAPARTLDDAAAGGVVVGGAGGRVELPPNALVDASGQPVRGSVQVQITAFDVAGERGRVFPGGFEALRGDGQRGFMLSHGAAEFELRQGGRSLDLAPGRRATVEIPVTSRGNALQVGDTVPLWSLDERTGRWIEEGVGVVAAPSGGGAGLVLRAQVGHFSSYNIDAFELPAQPQVTTEPCEARTTPASPVDRFLDALGPVLRLIPWAGFIDITRQLERARQQMTCPGAVTVTLAVPNVAPPGMRPPVRTAVGAVWRGTATVPAAGGEVGMPRGVPITISARTYVPVPVVVRNAAGEPVDVGVAPIADPASFIPSPPPGSGAAPFVPPPPAPGRSIAPDGELALDTTVMLPATGPVPPLRLRWSSLTVRNRWLELGVPNVDALVPNLDFVWRFRGDPAQALRLAVTRAAGTSVAFRGVVRGPSGAQVWSGDLGSVAFALFQPRESGTHTLVLSPTSGSGGVTLRLDAVQLARLEAASPGSFDVAGETDLYAVTAPATGGVTMAVGGGSYRGNIEVSVFDETGRFTTLALPTAAGWTRPLQPWWLEPGRTYLIQLRAGTPGTTGDYQLWLDGVEPAAPLTLAGEGTTLSTTFVRPSEHRWWRFTGRAGDVLNVVASTADSVAAEVSVYQVGTTVPFYAFPRTLVRSTFPLDIVNPAPFGLGGVVLPRDGEYYVALEQRGRSVARSTGRVSVRLLTPAPVPLPLGGEATVRTTEQFGFGALRLTVPADTLVTVAALADAALGITNLDVQNAAGRTVLGNLGFGFFNANGVARLPAGTYTVLVKPATGPTNVGSARVTALPVAPPTRLTLGTPVSGSFSRFGERQFLVVPATANVPLTITMRTTGGLRVALNARRPAAEPLLTEIGFGVVLLESAGELRATFTPTVSGDWVFEVAQQGVANPASFVAAGGWTLTIR